MMGAYKQDNCLTKVAKKYCYDNFQGLSLVFSFVHLHKLK